MKTKELIEYLETFDAESVVAFIALELKKREVYTNSNVSVVALTDGEFPVIGLELHESEPMDSEMIQACEECEQDG